MMSQGMKEGNLEWWTVGSLMPGEKAKSKVIKDLVFCVAAERTS